MKRSIKSLLENESKFVALLNPKQTKTVKGGGTIEDMPYIW